MSVGLLGSALVNGSGRTLYVLSADRGGKVTCVSSSCTSVWPPVLLSTGARATAGSGVDSSKLGTVKTPSGALQVAYNHWPLYTYSGDSGTGQTNGQGINSFGGVWHPIAPTGQPIVGGPSSTPTSSGGGY
jgi:predicted lipoprotein with Yx(FWY)xxD motif